MELGKRSLSAAGNPYGKRQRMNESEGGADNADPNVENRKIFIANIDNSLTREDVTSYVTSLLGPEKVESVHVVPKRPDAAAAVMHRGIAFILMHDVEDVNNGVEKLHGYMLGSRDLRAKRHTGPTSDRKIFIFGIDTNQSKEDTENFMRDICENASLSVESMNALPHKGYAFVILKDAQDIPIAVAALNGKQFGNTAISAQRHNRQWDSANPKIEQSLPPTQTNTLFIANIANTKSQEEVKSHIESVIGAERIKSIYVAPPKGIAGNEVDASIKNRGIAFMQMNSITDLKPAINLLNGHLFCGRDLRVKVHTGSTNIRKLFIWNIDINKEKMESEQFITMTLQRAGVGVESANVKAHKGYGFVVLERQGDIHAAVQILYGSWWGNTQLWAQRHNDNNQKPTERRQANNSLVHLQQHQQFQHQHISWQQPPPPPRSAVSKWGARSTPQSALNVMWM